VFVVFWSYDLPRAFSFVFFWETQRLRYVSFVGDPGEPHMDHVAFFFPME